MANDLTNTLSMLLDTLGEERATSIMKMVATPAKCNALQVEIQTRHALRLLYAGNTRPQIRDRLMFAHGIAKETAYMRINAAIYRKFQPKY